ncbi:MAG: hypothetical protein FWD83_10615 [Promicromonosporaceae bacterium]|nr:hypothetical protein [Promicromonosporaceae bacterium]
MDAITAGRSLERPTKQPFRALLGLGARFLSRTTEYFQAVYALLFGEGLMSA